MQIIVNDEYFRGSPEKLIFVLEQRAERAKADSENPNPYLQQREHLIKRSER